MAVSFFDCLEELFENEFDSPPKRSKTHKPMYSSDSSQKLISLTDSSQIQIDSSESSQKPITSSDSSSKPQISSQTSISFLEAMRAMETKEALEDGQHEPNEFLQDVVSELHWVQTQRTEVAEPPTAETRVTQVKSIMIVNRHDEFFSDIGPLHDIPPLYTMKSEEEVHFALFSHMTPRMAEWGWMENEDKDAWKGLKKWPSRRRGSITHEAMDTLLKVQHKWSQLSKPGGDLEALMQLQI